MPRIRSLQPTEQELLRHVEAVDAASQMACNAQTLAEFGRAIDRLRALDDGHTAAWAWTNGLIAHTPVFHSAGMESAPALSPEGIRFLVRSTTKAAA